MELELFQHKSKIDQAFKHAETISDEEIKSHFSKYLCILVSGYIETSLKTILYHYIKNCSTLNVSNFVNSQFQNITNLKDSKMQNILKTFSVDWCEAYNNALLDEEKDALDSIVANRNLIAHGKSVGISYVRMKEYYSRINSVIDNLKQIIK